jgi:hypothetical protein
MKVLILAESKAFALSNTPALHYSITPKNPDPQEQVFYD